MKLFVRNLIVFVFFLLGIFLLPSNVNAAELQPGSVWQWTTATVSATQKAGLTDIVSVSAGLNHSLALKSDGTVWAWGNNDNGQLGIGTSGGSSMDPVQVKSPDGLGYLTGVKAIAAGTDWFSMALKIDGTVWVWGYNGYGTRGTGIGTSTIDGGSSKLLLPTQVKGESGGGFLSQVISIAAGGDHSLALKSNGDVVVWGRNDNGQIGIGCYLYNCSFVYSPVKIISNVLSIAAGGYHSLVVKADGTVWGWGRTQEGQLGSIVGNFGVQGSPIQIPGIGGIKNVWAKDYTSMALSGNGTVFEWGNNRFSPDANPRQIPNLQDINVIAGGSSYLYGFLGAAIKNDGTVWVWNTHALIARQIQDLLDIGSISVGYAPNNPNLAAVKMPESTPTPTPTSTPTPTPTPTPKTPLILIPGIGGSEFKSNQTFSSSIRGCGISPVTFNYNADDLVWLDESRAAVSPCDEYLDVLKLKNDGQTPEYPQVILNGNLLEGAYGETIKFFTSNGYTLNKDFFVFPYDWRKDISLTKKDLDDKINQIKTQTGSQKVDIIAHSMGGLVARNYIADPAKAQNVRKLFTLGTPHLGSVDFLKNLRFGGCLTHEWLGILAKNNLCLGISPAEVKDIVKNMISGFELAPTRKYFDFYIGYNNRYSYPYVYNGQKYNYEQIKTFLTNLNFNTDLFIPSEIFHILDNSLSNTNGVDVNNIVGSGQETLGQIREMQNKNFFGEIVTKKDGFSINGDKTVPLFSASLIDPNRSISFLGDAKVFYTNQKHGELVSSGSALNLVENILDNNNQLPAGVSSAPYPFTGTEMSIYSPVNIHAYDSFGNHTGPTSDGNFEANIPGSSYDTLDDAKFIFLPNEGNYTIKFEATDQGSFDFKIRKYENDTIFQEILYKDVPLTNATKAETQFDTSSGTSPVIQLDENGNGIIQNINPSSNLTGNAVFDQTLPQTDIQIYGTLGNNGWFRSDAVVTLIPQDDASGSGILKTEYSLNNGAIVNIYTEPFTISTEKINKIKFRSIDNAGNEEDPQEIEIKIDKTLPKITIDANPKTLWPANNKMVNVKITGSSSDLNLLSTKITISDEYRKIEPRITNFGQTIRLQASRNGDDPDGRRYSIKAIAEDLAGNISQALTEVIVPHDERK